MEAKLVQLVEYYLATHLVDQAIFAAEHLLHVAPTEPNKHLLATTYARAGRHAQAAIALQESTASYNRYLLAVCLVKTGKYHEADAVLITAAGLRGLTHDEQVSKLQEDPYRMPQGAAGAYLLGEANRMGGNHDRASKMYMLAVYLDPFLWMAFEHLCILGFMPDPAQTFSTKRLGPDETSLSSNPAAREMREIELETRIAQEARHAAATGKAPAPPTISTAASRFDQLVAGGAANYEKLRVPVPAALPSPITPAARFVINGKLSASTIGGGERHGDIATATPGHDASNAAANFSSLSGSMMMASGILHTAIKAPGTAEAGNASRVQFGSTGGSTGGLAQPQFGGDTPASRSRDDSDSPAPASPGLFDLSAISGIAGGGLGGGAGNGSFYATAVSSRRGGGGGVEAIGGQQETPVGATGDGTDGNFVTPVTQDTTGGPGAPATQYQPPGLPRRGAPPPTAGAPRWQLQRGGESFATPGDVMASSARSGVNATVLNFDSAPRARPLHHVHPAFSGLLPRTPGWEGVGVPSEAARRLAALASPVPADRRDLPLQLENNLLSMSLSGVTPAPRVVSGPHQGGAVDHDDGPNDDGDDEEDGYVISRGVSAFGTPGTLLQRRLMLARRAAMSSGADSEAERSGLHHPADGTPASGIPAFRLTGVSGVASMPRPHGNAAREDGDVAMASSADGDSATPTNYEGGVGPAAIIMGPKARRQRALMAATGASDAHTGGIAGGAASRRATRLDFAGTGGAPGLSHAAEEGAVGFDGAEAGATLPPASPPARGWPMRNRLAAGMPTGGGKPVLATASRAASRSAARAPPSGAGATPADTGRPDPVVRLQEGTVGVLVALRHMAYVTRHLYRYEGAHGVAYLDDLMPPALTDSRIGLYLRGRCCSEAADYAGARDAFLRMRASFPHALEGLEYLSTALWHLREVHELVALSQELAATHPRAWQTWVAVGNAYSAQRDHSAALKAFQKAVSCEGGDNGYPHTLAGHEHMALGQLDAALASFRLATERSPRHWPAWHGMGTVYLKREEPAEAEAHFAKAISINRRSGALLVYQAMAQAAQGKGVAAMATLDHASQVDPVNPQAMYQRAVLLMGRKDFTPAVRELQAVQEVAPGEPHVLVALGRALKGAGRVGDAVAAWNDALSLTTSDKDALVIRNLLNTASSEVGDEELLF